MILSGLLTASLSEPCEYLSACSTAVNTCSCERTVAQLISCTQAVFFQEEMLPAKMMKIFRELESSALSAAVSGVTFPTNGYTWKYCKVIHSVTL